eukprot:Gb_20581 [translate_table: standard]
MSPKGQELAKKPKSRAKRIAHWQKEKDQADRRLPRTMEPTNPTRTPESNDKVTEETTLLAETKKCQPEAMPSGASPGLTCRSHTISNITHKPIETPTPRTRAKGDPLVFDISTNPIKKLTKRLLGSNPKRPPDGSLVTFPTNIRSFKEILESIINNLLKITLLEREDEPPCYVTEEETSTDNTDEASETSDSSEIRHKTTKPTGHNQKELVHKQKANNANPFASCGPTTHPNLGNKTQTPTNNAQPNQSMIGESLRIDDSMLLSHDHDVIMIIYLL